MVDQSQPHQNAGYWFEDDVIRWQEFIPTISNVSAVDLLVHKNGAPGNVLIELQTLQGTVLSQTLIPQDQVPLEGWISWTFDAPVPVTPGTKYLLVVYADQDSPIPDDRYFWLGDASSDWCPTCLSDVSGSRPDYRYALKTYGLTVCTPTPSPTPTVTPDTHHRIYMPLISHNWSAGE